MHWFCFFLGLGRVLGRGSRSKVRRHYPPDRLSGSSSNASATRLERRWTAESNRMLKGYCAHFLKNHHRPLGSWNILSHTGKELELVKEAKKYHLDIVGVSFTKKRGSGIADLEGEGGGSFSIQVLIQVSLLKRVWKFLLTLSCQTVCLIEFFWDHVSVC